MVQEGGLCGRCRHDRDLLKFSAILLYIFRKRDKPTVSLSSRRIFIFAAEVPAVALSPTDTILVM